jgi:hypothetical protein
VRARHVDYVGTLATSPDGIQLRGADPISDIRISLRIPVDEVTRVRVSREWDERLAGGRCAILRAARLGSRLRPGGRDARRLA